MSFDFSGKLNPGAPRAIYLQLLDMIEQQIAEKKLVHNDMLPSENEFCEAYGISRTTIRRTFRELEEQGLICRKRGMGTFITEQKLSRNLGNLYSFTSDMKKMGMVPSSEIISFKLLKKSECASATQAFLSERLIEVVRLRIANDIPMLIERTYLPVSICPNLTWEALENNSLYSILEEKYGLRPYKATETYEAIVMTEEEARLLKSEPGGPAFLLKRSTLDPDGRLLEYTVSVTPSSRAKFEIVMYHDSVQITRKTI